MESAVSSSNYLWDLCSLGQSADFSCCQKYRFKQAGTKRSLSRLSQRPCIILTLIEVLKIGSTAKYAEKHIFLEFFFFYLFFFFASPMVSMQGTAPMSEIFLWTVHLQPENEIKQINTNNIITLFELS